MTIKQIANRIIKNIKAWPEEAKQSQDYGSPKTSWDEYMEQIQYEEYDSFEIFEETIELMVRDEVSELSEKVIENLFRSRHTKDFNASREEKGKDIVNAVLYHIKSEAETQDIEYSKIDIEYIRYNVDDITIVAEVLSKVGPEEFLINGYSEVTGPGGEQGIANLSESDNENKLEWITPEEFEREKKSYNVKRLPPAEPDLENENHANKLLHNENKTDCLLTQSDQLYNPHPVLENKVARNKASVAKAVKGLVLLTAKATKKTPLEVIREMKAVLADRKLASQN